jgi:diguanylate cyclase (GGDEF)-like protein
MYAKTKAWLLAASEKYKLEWVVIAALATAAYDLIFGGKKLENWAAEFRAQLVHDYVVPGYVLDTLIVGCLLSVLTVIGVVLASQSHKKENRTLKEQAETDPLTGLPNVKNLEKAFEERRKDTSKPFCICYVDVVGFGELNNGFNHTAADKLLVDFVRIVKGELRSSRDKMFRIYGDEFVLLLNDTDVGGARICVSRIVYALETIPCDADPERRTNKDMKVKVPGRFGITDVDAFAPDETLASCVERADTAVNLLKAEDRDFAKKDTIMILKREEVDGGAKRLAPRRRFAGKPRPVVPAAATAPH